MLPRLVHLGESKVKFCSFPASGGSLANFGILWLAGLPLLPVLSGSHPLRVPVSDFECPPFSMTHSYWIRNHSNDLILTGSLQRFCFQTKWRSQTLHGRTSTTSTKTAFNPSQVGCKGLSSAGRKGITSIKLPWGRRICSQLQQLELPAALLEEESWIGFANGESANATHALFPRHLAYILVLNWSQGCHVYIWTRKKKLPYKILYDFTYAIVLLEILQSQ